MTPADPDSQFRIKRKPVASPTPQRSYTEPNYTPRPPLLATPSSNTVPDVSDLKEESCLKPPVERAPKSPTRSKSPISKAYGEARHFLGGLVPHPTESTKHFTILRHSHGVVFYRGSTTTVTISIFSDAPLSPDRTLWLQCKGFSGKTGMKAKAFFRLHDDWLDVTPTLPVTADQINPSDERAWQRDISKFYKKAPSRVRDTHQLRETAIARIPVEAGDGYFSVVLCKGPKKKVLCTSPVFRVLSTSTDPSSIRGASLSTLPLELGAMVLSLYGQAVAESLLSPAASTVSDKISPYQPSWVAQTAAGAAFEISGTGDRIGSAFSSSQPSVDAAHASPEYPSIEDGPVQPYPIDFKARAEVSVEDSSGLAERPKLNLRKVPDWVLDRFDGYYFGWARSEQSMEKEKSSTDWQQVILDVRLFDPTKSARVDISQALKRAAGLRFIDDVQLSGDIKVEIRIMGFLRPPPPVTGRPLPDSDETAAEAAMLADACDASYVQDILDHPAWSPNVSGTKELERTNSGMLDRTRTGLSNVKNRGQKLATQVPLHWIGVRSPMAEMSDRKVAVNGLYIVR